MSIPSSASVAGPRGAELLGFTLPRLRAHRVLPAAGPSTVTAQFATATIVVPMYSNRAGIIPLVEALLGKGAALGTVLAFMMAVIGLSLPEIEILRKVLRPRLIATFVGIVASGILLVGWLFNAVL